MSANGPLAARSSPDLAVAPPLAVAAFGMLARRGLPRRFNNASLAIEWFLACDAAANQHGTPGFTMLATYLVGIGLLLFLPNTFHFWKARDLFGAV